MFKFVVVLLLISGHVISGDDVTHGTELVMSLLIHRHGDRTPVESSLSLSTDPDALEVLSAPYGYGQLTKKGKQTAYNLGQYIRERYNQLLAPKYNRSEVYIRSTDYTRAKMTILTALAAVYPPTKDRWSKNIAWEPVPYTTLPVKYDFNTFTLNCPTFTAAYYSLFLGSASEVTAKYFDVLNILSNQIGYNITEIPAIVYAINDVYTSQMSLGLGLGRTLDAVYDQIKEAAGAAIDLIFGSEDYIALQGGVLLNEFYKYADLAIAGEDTQRLRIYSAHDVDVYSFEAVTKVNRQGVPKYSAAYSLEVRKVTSTGKYVVLPVYLPAPGEKEIYLQVEGCEQLCDYDQFVELTKQYSRNITTWREECGFTEDLVVDESSYE